MTTTFKPTNDTAMRKHTIISCSWAAIAPLLLQYHYRHSMPGGLLACFALLDVNDFAPIGAAAFANGRSQYAGSFIDFARMYMYDDVPKNSESYFIGQCMKRLAKQFPSFDGVVAWADPKQGHNGTIYKASNFVFDGYSRPVKRYQSLTTGAFVYQRTVDKEIKKYYVETGVDEPKLRFIYYFDPKVRERLRGS